MSTQSSSNQISLHLPNPEKSLQFRQVEESESDNLFHDHIQGEDENAEDVQMADHLRPMEELLRIPIVGIENAIVVPAVLADEFELKTELLDFSSLDISELTWNRGEIVCDNAKCEFQTKFVEIEKVLTQQTKDFNDVKLELSNITAKFEAYFEKLEKTKAVLERQLARKVDDSKAEKDQSLKEINLLRTQLENLKGKSVQTKLYKHSFWGKPPADNC
ncbi:hypothetical protein Tco_1379267 [Tanacetum coccineum]